MHIARRSSRILHALVPLLAIACSGGGDSGGTEPTVTLSASILEGDGGTAVAGDAVVTRPAVKVTTQTGAPRAGVSVTFAVTSGGGSASGLTATTDANGVARVGAWTLGATIGANTMSATVTGVSGGPLVFTVTGTAGAATTLVIANGISRVAVVGTAVAAPPAVRATDRNGNAVSGVVVTFTPGANGGSVMGGTATTDATGLAAVGGWTLGTVVGDQTLVASAPGIATPATFVGTATVGPVAQVQKLAGDGQTATVATTLPIPPSVKVMDQYGNPISNRNVVFTGSGTITPSSVATSTQGIATVGSWTLGTTAGAQVLGANATGASATFTATATPGPAAQLAKLAGDAQTASAGTLLPINPAVRVADQFGNVLAGRTVTFAVLTGGGTLNGASQVTGANGLATIGGWTLGNAVGAQTLQATADALTVVFNATATAVLNVAQYVGTYTGTWVNTTFGSVGTGTVVIANDAATKTATVTASATGSVLGTGGGVAPVPRSSVYGTASGSFTGVVPPMGTINGTIDANGNIVASGTSVPNASIARWDASGTITPTQILLNFTVTFTAGPPAVGTITLNKP